MSLLERARTRVKTQGTSCALSKLPPDLRAELDEALASDVDAEAISRTLNEDYQVQIAGQVLRNHRGGKCKTCRS